MKNQKNLKLKFYEMEKRTKKKNIVLTSVKYRSYKCRI